LTDYKPPKELEELLNKDKPVSAEKALTDSESKAKSEKELLELEESKKPKPYREGDGIKKDTYLLYCSSCKLEYIEKLDECVRCSKKMITNEERYDFLMTKVDQYKNEKANRKVKRSKWENWKKTSEIIYDK